MTVVNFLGGAAWRIANPGLDTVAAFILTEASFPARRPVEGSAVFAGMFQPADGTPYYKETQTELRRLSLIYPHSHLYVVVEPEICPYFGLRVHTQLHGEKKGPWTQRTWWPGTTHTANALLSDPHFCQLANQFLAIK